MHYFACDVSRDSISAVLTARSLRIIERFEIDNSLKALESVLVRLKVKHPHLCVGVESTSMFHVPVVEGCTRHRIPCRLINPILTREVIRGSIRGRKTDRDDALVIAKLLVQGEGRLVTLTDVRSNLKIIVRSAFKLRTMRTGLLLHMRYVQKLLGVIPESLVSIMKALEKAQEELKAQAIGQVDPGSLQLVDSIPGIGPWLATVILAEIGSVRRFPNGDALIAYAGLDPRIRQSGLMHATGRLTKRGSTVLRWGLFCGANIGRKYDPDMKNHYKKQRGASKPHTTAVCSVARKLTHRVFAVLKRQTPYVKREPTKSP